MRKVLFILALMFAVAISNAQMLTTNLGDDVTYAKITTDYTLTNATAKYWQINTNPKYYNAQTIVINMDSATGTHTNVAVAVYGRISDVDSWVQIGSTINWRGVLNGGAGADTTIIFTNSTENAYRQFKLLYTGTGTGTTTISDQVFKQYFGTP